MGDTAKLQEQFEQRHPGGRLRACTVKAIAIDPDKRQVRHLISTQSVDRDGDMIEVGGWDLSSYAANPVVLLDHNARIENIIGRGTPVITSRGLETVTTFGELGKAALAFHLVAEGFARAWSVGFQPTKYHSIGAGADAECPRCVAAMREHGREKRLGLHFVEQELREYSLVAIPANAEAVIAAAASGKFHKNLLVDVFGAEAVVDGLALLAEDEDEDGASLIAPSPRHVHVPKGSRGSLRARWAETKRYIETCHAELEALWREERTDAELRGRRR